jgi:prepilin-type N-terminal cleavage/methylation domain-containing protein
VTRPRSGLTLLELVVAIFLTGVVAASGYAALGTVADRRNVASAAMDDAAGGVNRRRLLAAIIAGAHMGGQSQRDFRGLDNSVTRLPADELEFVTSTPVAQLPGGDTFVRLRVDLTDSTAEQGLVLEMTRWPASASEMLRPVRLELGREIGGMDARYLPALGSGRRWLPSWISGSLMPIGVELRFTPAAGDSLAPVFQVPLYVPLGGR